MPRLTFKGGIHPFDGKKYTMGLPIEKLIPKENLVYPVSMHIGAPAKPLVKKGDRVLAGQLIAESGGFISANIHASVSGTVKVIEPRYLATGGKVDCIVVENDGLYESVDYSANVMPIEQMSREDIRKAVFSAGIVGMGGAGFPANVKLTPKDSDAIEYVIVNGAECEPYLTSDYRRMMEYPNEIVKGLSVVLRLFKNAKGIIAIEDNKPEAIKAMKEAALNVPNVEVKAVKTKYPQGGERFLIYAVTKREINYTKLPADAGCVIHNIDTIYAIYNAIYNGMPLIKRVVTVTGDAIKTPKNLEVLVGTNYRELLEACDGYTTEEGPKKIISGGPMMGFAMSSLDVPVTKTSSSLLALTFDDVPSEESPCIRCARCQNVCPGHVQPYKLAEFSRRGDLDSFVKNNGLECCECGCCSYVCPAKRHLTQRIKSMRKRALAARKK